MCVAWLGHVILSGLWYTPFGEVNCGVLSFQVMTYDFLWCFFLPLDSEVSRSC